MILRHFSFSFMICWCCCRWRWSWRWAVDGERWWWGWLWWWKVHDVRWRLMSKVEWFSLSRWCRCCRWSRSWSCWWRLTIDGERWMVYCDRWKLNGEVCGGCVGVGEVECGGEGEGEVWKVIGERRKVKGEVAVFVLMFILYLFLTM